MSLASSFKRVFAALKFLSLQYFIASVCISVHAFFRVVLNYGRHRISFSLFRTEIVDEYGLN